MHFVLNKRLIIKIFSGLCFLSLLILHAVLGEEVPKDILGRQRNIAWKCRYKGMIYHPNNHTTCVCSGLLIGKCKENDISSTTTARPKTTTSEPPLMGMHPLDQLTPNEIRRAKEIFDNSRTRATSNYIYNWITLQEPPKADLLQYFLNDVEPPRTAYERKALIILIEKGTGQVYEVVVNLDTEKVESFTDVPEGNIPSRTPDDDDFASLIAKSNTTVQERCRLLGYPNMSLVYTASWPQGYVEDIPEYKSLKRAYDVQMYGRNFENDHPYAHPFDFVVIVDLIEERVIAIEELPTHNDFDRTNKNGNTVPRTPDNYDYKLKPSNFLRTNDRPIKVVSPKGPSYKVNGNAVEWQNFKMRIGFNSREGLVIHNVLYNDKGKKRPILYRASWGEVGISYSDPRPPFHRKAGFDEADGLGSRTNELIDQEHCIGETHFIDGYFNNNTGDPKTIKNAICITEEDAGILWQHLDPETFKTVVTRSHRLAISTIATVGNYDFIFRWLFYQDASIQLQTSLTGILSTSLIALDATPEGRFGSTVFPQVDGQYHQHYFSLRLDTEIDGNENSVYMSEAVPYTNKSENQYGNGFFNKKTHLKTASEARTNINSATGRTWVIANPNKNNTFTKQPVGWKLIPQVTPPLLLTQDSPLRPKVAFLEYDIWVTKYQENQLYSGGFYLNHNGLPEWVGENPNESVENTDVVIWHSFRNAHIPRIEDFPVMPFEDLNVWLRPYNFFLENPGLNIPPTEVDRQKTEL